LKFLLLGISGEAFGGMSESGYGTVVCEKQNPPDIMGVCSRDGDTTINHANKQQFAPVPRVKQKSPPNKQKIRFPGWCFLKFAESFSVGNANTKFVWCGGL
jgi:hypothetical protein